MIGLFQLGNFKLASGEVSMWKIECDALTEDDWDCLAAMAAKIVPYFGSVVGVPQGGLPFAKALRMYVTAGPRLVVDDVFTTGGSLRKIMQDGDLAVVAFARNPPPPWLCVVWQLSGGVHG